MIENSTLQVIKYNNHVELQQSRVTASLENCAMSTPNNHHLKLNLCLDYIHKNQRLPLIIYKNISVLK